MIQQLIDAYFARFRNNLTSFDDALALCHGVEEMLNEHNVPPGLRDDINASRRRILDAIIQRGLTERALTGTNAPRFTLQFPQENSRERSSGRRGGQSRERSPDEYRRMVEGQNFDLVRLASRIGADAAADALCALGLIGDDERPQVISFISAYLGPCSRPPSSPGPGEFLAYPRPVLDVPSVASVVERVLIQEVYRDILSRGSDDPAQYERIRQQAASLALHHMQKLAREAQVTDPAIHAGLFVGISEFIGRSFSQPHPQTLVRTLRQQGRNCPFPSSRQLMASQRIRERRKVYLAFDPGLGKTGAIHYVKEQLRQERRSVRTLYLGPLNVIQQVPNLVRPGSAPQPTRDCYYVNPDTAPTVGIVQSGLNIGRLESIVHGMEEVYCPYSMLHSSRNLRQANGNEEEEEEEETEQHLIDLLCAQNWDILVLDEAHNIDGNKTWTRLVDRIIHGQDGRGTHLSRQGLIIPMSGSPFMNTVADPVIIHDVIHYPPQERERRYGVDTRETVGRDVATERRADPIRVRQALNETLFALDPYQPWLEHIRMLEYSPTAQEMEFLRGICSNPTLHDAHKMNACQLFLLCPQLVSGDDHMPESLLGWMLLQLESDLDSGKRSVLIAEHMRALGVMRTARGEDAPDQDEIDRHFFTKLQAFCVQREGRTGVPVHFHTVHRDTAPEARQQAYAEAAEAKTNGDFENVIFAMSQCLNTGIRLHLDRIIALEWPYNSPELQQLLKRALREGETDVILTACYALGTMQQGIYEQAIDKLREILTAQYGESIANTVLRSHQRDHQDTENVPVGESDLFRLLLRSSSTKRRYEVERWLHGRGMNEITQFWDRHRDLFGTLHQEADELGTGDMQRFLGGLVNVLVDRSQETVTNILDVGSDGLTLEREIRRLGTDNQIQVASVDSRSWMLERGRAALHTDDPGSAAPRCFEADIVQLHYNNDLRLEPYDIGVLRHLNQCHHIQSDQTVHERARTLLHFLRRIKIGGRVIIPLSRTACTTEEFNQFVTETLPLFGCLPIDGWTGTVRSQDNEGDVPFRGFCVVAEKQEDVNEGAVREHLQAQDLRFSHHSTWATTAQGVRVDNEMQRPRLPSPLRHEEFRFGNRTFTAAHAKPDIRDAQVQHLRALEDAVQVIRTLAPTRRDWKTLAPTQRSSLQARGILHSTQLSQTVNRPTFSLRDYPGHLFFPYDQQWRGEIPHE